MFVIEAQSLVQCLNPKSTGEHKVILCMLY